MPLTEPAAPPPADVDPLLCGECEPLKPTAIPAAARVSQNTRAQVSAAPARAQTPCPRACLPALSRSWQVPR